MVTQNGTNMTNEAALLFRHTEETEMKPIVEHDEQVGEEERNCQKCLCRRVCEIWRPAHHELWNTNLLRTGCSNGPDRKDESALAEIFAAECVHYHCEQEEVEK